MDFQHLKTFRTVASLMNFNRAADVLHYAQSSVSAQIKALENDLGTELFRRNGKKISLTPAGEKMLAYAHKLLAIEEEARGQVAGRSREAGLLTLRMPQTVATYLLPRVLEEFTPLFPRVHFDVTSCALYSLENELSIGTVDLAFLLTESIGAAGLSSELLRTEPLVWAAAPGHPLCGRKNLGVKDLAGQTLFLPKADCGYRMDFEQALAMEKVAPERVIELNSIEAIKEALVRGMGATVIPEISIARELAQGSLAKLDWEEELETGVLMIWHKDKWFPPALAAFMEAFRRVLG